MASPDTRTFTEDEEIAYDSGRVDEHVWILNELRHFWCGEPLCDKHPVNMEAVIKHIKEKAR